MKKLVFCLCTICCFLTANANHIKGGWIYYEYLGPGLLDQTALRYRITVKVYRDCGAQSSDPSNPQNDAAIPITIFNGGSSQITLNTNAPRTRIYRLEKGFPNPCMTNPPQVCYVILEYITTVELPQNVNGYTLSFQRCCRIGGIANIQSPSNNYGNTYSTTIPGTINTINFAQNNSPQYAEKDTAIICFNSPFTLDYSATDADGDSLVYSLCPALAGGSNQGNGAAPNPAAPPPYPAVPYSGSFSSVDPFGTGMVINGQTGIISGTAPSQTGEYVVSVCVEEFRQGISIGTTRKELHIIVGNCALTAATLQPTYTNCQNFTLSFQNESQSSNIIAYAWDFGVPNITTDVSTSPTPSYTYPDTGRFILKLKVLSAAGCQDSTTAIVNVYPTFNPGIGVVGSCFQSPFQFTDASTSTYGLINFWSWSFGDGNTSSIQNPQHTYTTPGNYTVRLIAANNKGCRDTLDRQVIARDVPLLTLPFKDTLICSIDTLPLIALGSGNFSWTPNYNISNTTISNPFVFPQDTTKYIVTLNENGCVSRDTITVNVLDFITVRASADTGICLTDNITINTVSDALSYQWTPAIGLDDATKKQPIATPLTTTTYYVTANLGKCQDRDSIRIAVTPYPQANAGPDATICYGSRSPINATFVGSVFNWSPRNTLLNPNTLNPVAGPPVTTTYVLSAFDTLGCPKPFRDSITITVIPPVNAFAGRDTLIVAGQPLQLQASGGDSYAWSPTTGLSDPNIANPVATLSANIDSIVYLVRVSTADGCFATDDIKVRVFKTGPEIFVPTAFTPNGDFKNDVLKAIPVGLKQFNYFRIYNRWGQMVFSTGDATKGWDGTLAGKTQGSGTFVYTAEGIDYLGNRLFRKGTVVLIR